MKKLKGWYWIIPSLIGVLIFSIIPFGTVIYYSVIKNVYSKEFVGTQNFIDLLNNDAFQLAITNTLIFSIVAIFLSMIVSLFFALKLEKSIPGQSLIRTLLVTPLMIPTVSIVLIWKTLFHDRGYINSFLATFNIDIIHWLHSGYGMLLIIMIFFWKTMGYNMILLIAGIASVPRNQLEAAEVDGASGFWSFYYIKLRYILPTLFFVLLFNIISSFKVFREVYFLVGYYPAEKLYMLQHFINNTFESGSYPKLSTASLLIIITMTIVIGLLYYTERKLGKDFDN